MNHKDKGLTAFGLTMLALGTIVGGSFFLGVAIPIRNAGPAVIVSFLLGGGLVYLITFALSEMTVADATPGSFRTFAERAYGPGLGFVVGWVYWTGLILAMSSEATAVSIFLSIWFPNISLPVLGSIIIIGVTLLNLLGADKLSKLESGLAAVKLIAVVGFIVIALALISGKLYGQPAIGLGALSEEPILPNGISGIAGGMLIVIFSYAGFEIIGLAASETTNPHETVPKAIRYTVLALVALYTISITLLLPLIPTQSLSEEVSPFVAAFQLRGISWAAGVINIVMVTAILSTMLAATFGLGRMIRSLADEGYAPLIIKDTSDIPYRGIIFSGLAMLLGLGLAFMLPKDIYIFLVSSGGFSLLFTYLIILITHNKFRQMKGCPPKGQCQLSGYPYTSWLAIGGLFIIIASMPLVKGQGTGLLAGLLLVGFYSIIYILSRHFKKI